ncbi:MAG: hypothetical protein ABJZ55_17315 [Fuerstiella sp.]
MSKPRTSVTKPAKMISAVHRSDDAFLIQSRPSKGSGFFLLLWLTGWTVGCVVLAAHLIAEPSIGTFCFAIPFFASWLAVAAFLIWLWFGQESVLVKDDEILFRRTAIIELTTRRIPICEVTEVKSCRSSHTENDEHLEGVEIVCLGKPLKFCFRLSDHERSWIIQELSNAIKLDDRLSELSVEENDWEPTKLSQSEFHSRPLTPADGLSQPPSDSNWQLEQLPDEITFHRRGTFSIGGFLATSFICLFWNGIVSVFVLVLWGLMPGDAPPQGGEWWALFFFLIPFEVIGLGMLAAWLAVVLAPFSRTVLGIRGNAVFKEKQWPFFQSSKKINCLEVAQIHLRKADQKQGNLTTVIPSQETFELTFVSNQSLDLLTFKQLSQGDALWVAGHLFEFEDTWANAAK